MDFLRTIVSGEKKRFIDRKYNLDLSYITPRIIAMSYPASGIEGAYRNNINNVSRFLKERHKSNFLVINLSGRKYDNTKFNNNYDIVDHNPPKMSVLLIICNEINNFLMANDENVVAVNCTAGKGRTGTIICCYLIFSGRFNDANDALEYYSKKRFNKGEAVTQPSQKRYVFYFERILRENIYFPLQIGITSISINKFPFNDYDEEEFKPYFEIYLQNNEKISFSTKLNYLDQKKIFHKKTSELLDLTDKNFILRVCGDVTIKIFNNCIFGHKKLGNISFNTAFFEPFQNEQIFLIEEVDPDTFSREKNVKKDFRIHIKFQKFCLCKNRIIPLKVCDVCEDFLKHELKEWKEIQKIKKSFINNNIDLSKKILFVNSRFDDVERVLKNNYELNDNIQFNKTEIKQAIEENTLDDDVVNIEELKINPSSFENECKIL